MAIVFCTKLNYETSGYLVILLIYMIRKGYASSFFRDILQRELAMALFFTESIENGAYLPIKRGFFVAILFALIYDLA